MTTPTLDPETAATALRIERLEAEAADIWALREPILQKIDAHKSHLKEIEAAHAKIKNKIDQLRCSEMTRENLAVVRCGHAVYKAGLCKPHHALHKQIVESALTSAEDQIVRLKRRLTDLESE